MGKELWERPWFRHVAIALGYGLAVVVFRALSVSHWMILDGLRLAVFLLVPYRYWPALLVGESGYFIYLSAECFDQWGGAWAAVNLVPPSLFLLPLIYWAREQWPPVSKTAVNIAALLGCALLMSFIGTIRDVSMVRLMHLPANYMVNYGALAARCFIGDYLGILTVTPLVLVIHRQLTEEGGWRQIRDKIVGSRLVFESACVGLPVLAFLLWLGMLAPVPSETRQLAQIAMFLPVVWLAFRHGWQGAAVGGTVASCAIKIMMPALYDHHTIQAEILVAFAISSMLLMGARIAALDRRAEQEQADLRMALALAQRNVYIGEMQLRMASQTLEQVRETIHAGFTMMLGRLRHLQPAVDDRGYQRHALAAQEQLHRLADSLYPASAPGRALPTALREGAMVRLLNDAGLLYSCDVRGQLSQLSNALRMTIYRIVCEAIADACSKKDVSGVRVQIRYIEHYGRRGVMVRVCLAADPIRLVHIHWDELLAGVARSSSGLGLRAIQDRAATFEGRAKMHSSAQGRYISALLLEPVTGGG